MIDSTVPTNSNSSLDDILSELETQFGSSPSNTQNSVRSGQKKTNQNDFPSFKKPLFAIIALLVLVVGTGIALFVTNTAQDLRQQAAEEGGTATLILKPGSQSGIQSGSQTSLDLVANAGTNVEIVGIQLVADITGNVPPDLHFAPETIAQLNLVVNTLEDTQGGKRLTVAYLTEPPASYSATNSDVKVGAIQFTALSGEGFSVSFDNTLTKIVRKGDSQDILQPGESYTYSSVADATATPTPTPGQGGVTATPTNTPVQPSNTPASSAATCNPNTIQPESGPAPLTVALIGGGTAGSSGLVGYQWDFENDGIWDTSEVNPTLNSVQHTYQLPGTYDPKYRILDESGLWSEICDYNYSVIVTDSLSPTEMPFSSATPTIPIGDMCLSASVVNPNRGNGEATRIGDTINILCGEVVTAGRYEFRVQNPSGMIDTLQPISSGARQSQPYQITTSGKYYMQCRICTDDSASSCSTWEATN